MWIRLTKQEATTRLACECGRKARWQRRGIYESIYLCQKCAEIWQQSEANERNYASAICNALGQ